MQEDNKLKQLLKQWAVENPPVDFTSNVMKRITSTNAAVKTPAHVLFKQPILKLVSGIFIIVCIILFALGFTIPAVIFPFQATIQFPVEYFMQSIQFIVIFWIVMLLNLAYRRYVAKPL